MAKAKPAFTDNRVGASISNVTVSAESGKPMPPETARAIERLADAIIACATALRGTAAGTVETGISVSNVTAGEDRG